ncbi:MAG: hypothetical protein LKH43_08240 [Lactobacillus crispatus]|nr:hypothetical protein [Lactobacillus crispatus]MCI1366093.1 hypothetical protein [Lactobacillus crispatus]MCI1494413.1 hypothetical protein [Lactobacillus crispatus]
MAERCKNNLHNCRHNSHGKTDLAQKLIKKTGYACLNEDLLKMGLIRSHQTDLTVEDDAELTPPFLCP